MGQDARPTVLLYIVEAGGGHRAAANALVTAARALEVAWRFEIVDLERVLARLDLLRRLTGLPIDAAYNQLLRTQRTRLLVPLLRLMQWAIRLLRGPLRRELERDLARRRPALAISLAPNFNRPLRDAVRRSGPAPFFVLLTDLADFPPRFWLEPGIDGAIVGSERAAAQARVIGLPEARIHRTSGMVLHPRFYPPGGHAVRARVRDDLGIARDVFATLVLFGAKGSAEMRPLCRALLAAVSQGHVIAICGDNDRLRESLGELEQAAAGRLHRLGFTDRVADYLAAADVLVTKPGPGSLAEAFHVGVPVVVTRNAATIPQERYNAEFVAERGIGLVVRDWREMPAAVKQLAGDAELRRRMRGNMARLPANRAVFEVLELVGATLGFESGSGHAAADDRIVVGRA